MKMLIWIGLFVGSTLGGWLGALMANGNWLSWQSVLVGAVGSFAGIYAGYKASQYI
jgi:outer membrane lipoprotein SlyB